MNQYIYARESKKMLVILGLVGVLPAVALGIFLIIVLYDVVFAGYAVLAAAVIIFIIWFIYFMNILKWRKWHRRVKQNGEKVDGKVVDYGYRYTAGSLTNDPATPPSEEYWLVVEYMEPSGRVRKLKTPVLSFPPEERNDITCKVYIFGYDVLATDFVNLKRRKTNWGELFIGLLLVAVLIGIAFLVN